MIGQANNVFAFPGVGMGAVLSEIREVDEAVYLVAARTLADCVSPDRLELGALFPDQSELRAVSARIAAAVVRYASERNLGHHFADEEVERVVEAATWYPEYVPIVSAGS